MKNMYYKTCAYCGASLDPGETCDCQIEKDETPVLDCSETFLVSYDAAHGADVACCLQVVKTDCGCKVVNVFYGKEAEELHNKLVSGEI